MPTKTELTRERIETAAMRLFVEQGFEETTVAQIAEAAGVSEMTFFRYFTSKDAVVIDDPYDPVVAACIAERPRDEAPMLRAAEGFRAAWRSLPEPADARTRDRVRVAAAAPSLRGTMYANNAATEAVVAAQLIADGADALAARVAASACLAALTTALFEWAMRDGGSLGEHVEMALDVVVAR